MKRVDLDEALEWCLFVLAPNLVDTKIPRLMLAELAAARKIIVEAKRLGFPPDTTRLDDAIEDYDNLFGE